MKNLLYITALFMLVSCSTIRDDNQENEKQVQIIREEIFSAEIDEDAIEIIISKEFGENIDNYYKFIKSVSVITDMYNRIEGEHDLLWNEKNDFITNSLLKFLNEFGDISFGIEKVLPFITVCSSADGRLKTYSWWNNDYGKYKGYNSIIRYSHEDKSITKKLDDYSVEYTKVITLKDDIYLLYGETYTGNGIEECELFAVEIKEYAIEPYSAFNKEAGFIFSIDGLGDSRVNIYGSVYDRLVDCVLHTAELPIRIEFTKIIINDEIKTIDANGELAMMYQLKEGDYELKKISLIFNGTEFAGDYKKLEVKSRLEGLIENFEKNGLSQEYKSFFR